MTSALPLKTPAYPVELIPQTPYADAPLLASPTTPFAFAPKAWPCIALTPPPLEYASPLTPVPLSVSPKTARPVSLRPFTPVAPRP